MLFLIKGLAVGFSVAAPVGPIGVLCIRRTLAKGRISGLVSGLGAATADAIYGSVAAFGLTFISNFLMSQQSWLRLAGGGFLLYLGIKTFIAEPFRQVGSEEENTVIGDYASTFFLTITNPTTILSFTAIFAGLGLGSTDGTYFSASVLVCGVFLGSALWWLILSGSVNILRKQLGETVLEWVNRISGSIIFAFGVAALAGFFL